MATLVDKASAPARPRPWRPLVRGVAALWRKQMRGLLASPSELGGAIAMPALWMVLFGLCMGQTVTDPARTGGVGYIAFITPGVMLLAALTAAAMAGATLLLDRLGGALKAQLVAPIPRAAIPLGLLAGALTKALAQGGLILLLGLLLGARLASGPAALLLASALLAAFVSGFAGLAAAFAGRARSMEGYHGLIMLLNLPMLAAARAPGLAPVASLNFMTPALTCMAAPLKWNGGAFSFMAAPLKWNGGAFSFMAAPLKWNGGAFSFMAAPLKWNGGAMNFIAGAL